MNNKPRETDILNRQFRKQVFWKYHCLRLSPMEFYLSTNPDSKHKYARHGPGYFVKLEKLDENGKSCRFIFKQNTEDNVKPFIVEKIDDLWRIRCQYLEYVDGLVVKNLVSNTSRDISLTFDCKENKNQSLNNELTFFDDYKMQNLRVTCIKERKMTMFGKGKYDGVKLAKDKSVYFLDTGFFKMRKWYDQVVAVWRPCNRNVKSKVKIGMMSVRSSKLDVADNHLDDDDNKDEDEDYDDEIEGVEYYDVKDGLFERHPVDDSPNDFKVGWLTIYDKGRYFEKIAGGGNWEVVLGLTFASGIEKILDRFV